MLFAVMLLDDLALHPYQLAYLNESSRIRHDHTTTSLDYWAVSSKEALHQAQLNGVLELNATVDDALGVAPLFIAHRQLAGRVEAGAQDRLIFQIRNPPEFKVLLGCRQASQVSRTLSTGQPLVMSRLWLCPSPSMPTPG
jgi:hypothetical protein